MIEVRMVQGRTRDEARIRWIRELRAKGWSFARIAEEAGVSAQAIHHAVAPSTRKRFIARCRVCRKPFPPAGALPGDDRTVACPRCLASNAAFFERVRSYRLAIGLTRAELARKTGVSPTLLRQYEQGLVSPRLDKLTRLISVLGIGLVPHRPGGKTVAG
jgi:transcriptional regulator with XRE-family HTH domain